MRVHHGERGLAVAHGLPGRDLLVDARAHVGRVGVHQVTSPGPRRRGQEVLQPQDPDEPFLLAHHHVGRAVERWAGEAVADGLGARLGGCHWNPAYGVLRRSLEREPGQGG
jgi:hypothetical protein